MDRTVIRLFQLCLTILFSFLAATNEVLGQCSPSNPVAAFTQNEDSIICSGTEVQFYSNGTAYKPAFSWDFGNTSSTADTASRDTVSYTFTNTGTGTRIFHVFLLVIDSCGNLDSTSQNIYVSPAFGVNFTIPAGTYACDSLPVSFSNSSSGTGLTYSWNFDDPGSGSLNTSASANPSHRFDVGSNLDTFFIKLVVQDTCGNRDSLIRQLIVSPNPSANFTYTDSLCAGTMSFSNTSNGTGLSYAWNFGDPNSGTANTSTQTSPGHVFDTTGSGFISYQVKLLVTNVYGCKDSTTKARYVRRGPDATVDDFTSSTPFTQCSTTPTFLLTIDNSSTTSNNVYYLIDWGDTSGIDSLTSFSSDTHTYSGFGLRNLVVKVVDNVGCSKSDTFRVFNGSNPSGGLASPGSTINLCAPIQLGFPLTSVSNNPSGTTYTLSVNDGSNSVIYTHPPPDTIFHTFTEGSCGTTTTGSTTYNNSFSVTLTITNPCGFTASSILPITISGKPTAVIQSTHDTACIDKDLVTLSDRSSGATYVQQTNPPGNFTCDTVPLRRWRMDRPSSDYQLVNGFLGGTNFNNNTAVGANGNGSPALDFRFTDTGRFIISLLSGYPSTNTQKCGYDSTAIVIYVVDTVVAGFNFALNPLNGCINNSFTPSNLSTGPVASYLWTVSPSTGFSFQTGNKNSATPTLRFTKAGVFTVNMKVIGYCNEDDTSTAITIRSRPDVSLPADTAYCGVQTLNFSNSLHAPSIDTNYSSLSAYRWRIMGGGISFSGGTDSTSLHPQVQFSDTGRYTVVFTASNTCGESVADTQMIYIRPIPRINGTLTDISSCPGDSIFPPALFSNPPGAAFTWTNSNTAIGLGDSGTGQIPDFPAATNFTGSTRNALILITSSLNGCVYVADTLEISVKPEPVATTIADIIVCPGETVNIPAFSSSPTGSTFSWTNTNDSIGLGTSGTGSISSFTAPANNGTTAISGIIRYTPTLNGCVGAPDSFEVAIRTRPTMVALADTTVCPDITLQYPAFNSIPSGATFTWYNSNTAIGLSDTGTGSLPGFTAFHNTTGSNVSAQIRVVPNYNVCVGFADTFIILVRPAPQIQPTNDTSVCPEDSVFTPAFTTNPSGSAFSWTNSATSTGLAASGSGNIAPFIAAGNQGGSSLVSQVRVLPQLNGCAGYADTFLITVKPAPVAQSMSDVSACPGDTLSVNAFSSTPSGAGFVWTNTNTGIGLVSGASGNLPSFAADTNSSGISRVGLIRYTPTLQGCVGETDSFNISVKPTPFIATQADVEVCTWEIVQVANFSSSPSGSSFTWTNTNTAIGLSGSGSGNISSYAAPANISGSVRIGQVRVKPTLSLCQGPEDTFEIRILPQPTANAGMDDTLCNGQSTQIGQSSQTGESYAWNSIPGGFTDTSALTLVNPSTSTSFILRVYDSVTTCLQRDTVGIIVNPVLTNTAISADQLICAGQTPNSLSGNTPSGGNTSYTYQWQQSTDSANWTDISNSNSTSYSPGTLQVNTHYRRVVVSGPCSDTSNIVRVVVLPGISNNFIGISDSICAFFAPDTLKGSNPAGGSGTYSYAWQSTSDTTQSATAIGGAVGQDYFPGTLSSTTWFRRVVSSGACSVPGNWVEIRVKPKPSANFTASNACFAYAHGFTNQSSVSSGSIDAHFWDFGDTSTSSSANPQHMYAYPGGKTVKLIVSSDFGCRDSVNKTVFTHPKPSASFDSTNACLQLANSFSNTSTLSSGSIQSSSWSFGDGNFSSITSPSHIYGSTGTYPVRLIITSDSGCTDSAFKTVNVYHKPLAAFVGEDVCFNQITHFTDAGTVGAGSLVSWEWDFGDNDTSSTRHPVHTYTGADTFTVTLYIESDRGCLDTATGDVIVYPSISNNTISADDTICAGSQTNVLSGSTPQGGTGAYAYEWQGSTDTVNWASIGGATGINLAAQTLSTSTWFRRIVTSTPCDSNERHVSNRVFILVTPGISDNFIGRSDSICAYFAPDTIRGLLPVGGNGTYSYAWEQASDSTQSPSIISGSTAISYFPGTLTSSIAYRRVVSSGSCDTRSNWVEIRVKPKPAANFSATNACYGYSHGFTNQSSISSGSIDTYLWNFGDTSFSSGLSPTHSYAYPGGKTVKLIVSSDFGCRDSVNNTVFTHPKPSASFDSTNACLQLANSFTNTSGISSGTIQSHSWNFGDGGTSSAISPSHIYSDTGTYAVRLIITSDSGCTDSSFKTVEVYPKPFAGFVGEDVCFNQITHFTDTSSVGAGTLVAWAWHFGDTDTSSTRHPVHTYTGPDTFTVTLYIETDRGCLDTAGKDVIVYPSISNNTISADDTICAGSQTDVLNGTTPQGGTGNYVYEWQSSTDSVNWTSLSGANTLNLTSQSPTVSTWYRRVVTSSPCDSNERDVSNKVLILVTAGISNNTITADQITCFGQAPDTLRGSTPAGGTGNFNYQWQQSSDNSVWTAITGATGIDYFSLPLTDTLHFRRIVLSQACDLSSNSIKVAVKPLPEVGFLDSAICYPEVSRFTDTSVINQGQIDRQVFYFGDGDSAVSGIPIHYYGAAGTYTVRLYVESNFGCIDSNSRNHIVHPKPEARIYQENSCFPFSMDFRDSSIISSGNLSAWTWYFGDGDSSTLQHPAHSYQADGTYSTALIVQSNQGCRDTATQAIRIFPKPEPLWGSTEVCFPNATNFYDSSTLNSGQLQAWSWEFGDGSVSAQQFPVHQYTLAGSYTVKLIVVSDSNCVDSLSKTIEVRPLPVVSFLLDTLGCLNAANTFTNQSSLSVSQLWKFGNGQTDTGFHGIQTYSSTGSYLIRLVSTTAYGCVDSTDRQLRIIAPPVVQMDLSLDSGCGPLQVGFSNTSINEFPVWQWSMGNGTTYSDTFPPDEIYQPSLISDTTYYVRLIASNKCGIDSAIDSVRVLPVPTAVLGQTVNQGCSPFSLQLLNGSFGRPHSYTWLYGDGDSSDSGLGTHFHTYLTGSFDTIYFITLIASNQCGVDTSFGQILVKPNTVTSFFNTDTTRGCAPLAIQFTDLSQGGNYLYYDFGDGNTSLSADPVHTFPTPGFYTIQQFVDNGCSFDTSSIQIEVLPNLSPNFQINKNAECLGTAVNFTNQTAGTGALRWYFGDGDSSDMTNAGHAYTNPGTYIVTLRVISAVNGCPSTTTKPVQIHALPGAQFTLPVNQACPPFTPVFQNTTGNGQFYTWHFGDGNSGSGNSPSHSYTQSGSYTVRLIAQSALGCVDSFDAGIQVHPVPIAGFTQSFDTECDTPATLSFTNTSSGASTYLWNFGNGNQSVLNQPVQTYSLFSTYPILLRAENSFGCWDTASSRFTVHPVPVAAFGHSPDSGCMPLEIQFFNNSQNTGTYIWDFGDGSGTLRSDSFHTYTQSGTYTVQLIAFGAASCSDTLTKTDLIRVFPKPQSIFTYVLVDDDPVAKGLVRFINQSQFADDYYWSFGDGEESEGSDPVHQYRYHGSYIVQLAISNEFGCEDTSLQEIPLTFFKGLFVPNAFTPEYGTPEVRVFKPVGTSLKTYHLRIFDTYGNLLWESKELINSEPAEGWSGRVDGQLLNQDVYVWKIEAEFLDGTIWPGVKGEDGKFRKEGTVSLIR